MGATYKLKRKKADGTLEDVILQGVITDLGEQEDNALAEQAILELLKPTSVQTGGYLYTYHTTCRNDAVMAICSKTETVINITYISSLNGTVKYSSYDIEREELQSECWRLMADRNPSFESVNIGEYDGESQYNNYINAQGFYIDYNTTDGSDYLSFNINDGVEATDRNGNSLVLNSGFFGAGDSDGNWLEIRPSAITHNDNEYQFPNKSGTLAVTEDIPSVGNGTITIKQSGTTKGTFTINQSGDTTIELGDAYVIQAHTTTDANYPLLFKLASGITTTGNTTNSTRYANNIYVNPSTGTVYANDFVVDGKSIVGGLDYDKVLVDYAAVEELEYDDDTIYWDTELIFENNGTELQRKPVNIQLPLIAGDGISFTQQGGGKRMVISATGSGGGVQKLTPSTTHSLTINSTTVGAHFNVFGCVEGADELTIGSNSISLDSGYSYFVSIEGNLGRRANNNNYWNVMATVKQYNGTVAYYSYFITSSSGFNIADTGQVATGAVVYGGILYE